MHLKSILKYQVFNMLRQWGLSSAFSVSEFSLDTFPAGAKRYFCMIFDNALFSILIQNCFFFYKKVEEILVKNAYRKIATEYAYWAKRRLCKLLRLLYKRCSVNALYVVKEDFQNVLDKTQVSNNYVTRSSHTYVCIFYSFMNYHVWKGSIHSDGFEWELNYV